MSEVTPSKRCRKCGQVKPASEFGRDKRRRDGLFPYCKACRRRPGAAGRDERISKHPLYGTWYGMLTRCENPKHQAYRRYGGRGIKVCDRWHDVRLFIADILSLIGPRPPGRTLDRIDNDGDYAPGNVRWATASGQKRNSHVRGLTPRQRAERRARVAERWQRGETRPQIAEALGVSYSAVRRDVDMITGTRS